MIQFVILHWLHGRMYKRQNGCNFANESSHDLNHSKKDVNMLAESVYCTRNHLITCTHRTQRLQTNWRGQGYSTGNDFVKTLILSRNDHSGIIKEGGYCPCWFFNWCSASATHFWDLLASVDLKQWATTPTHASGHTLDLARILHKPQLQRKTIRSRKLCSTDFGL